jgi:5,6-dimethylbenzimidazole synthase
MKPCADEAPMFDAAFRARLEELFLWRRDVRRFRSDPVDAQMVRDLIHLASRAPSVGFSQPWRFVLVESAARRAAVREIFLHCNQAALADHAGERATLYAALKLAGLDEAPLHLAVFADRATGSGHGLGRKTMPEMIQYSAVLAVHTFWLAARAEGIGVGWVSILDREQIASILDVPQAWDLVAYLCVGYPMEPGLEPELLRRGWQERDPACCEMIKR